MRKTIISILIFVSSIGLITIIISFLVTMFLESAAEARVVGQAGVVYPILEKDAIQELEKAAAAKDWNKVFGEALGKARDTFGVAGKDLFIPSAPESSRRLIDMSYTLPFDIPDPNNLGKVLYPAGLTFNPLEYGQMYESWVFFDGSDPAQVRWFSKEYKSVGNEIPILTGGNALDMEKKFKRPFYVATGTMLERFKVRYVPCAARQEGTAMIVEETHVSK